MSQNILSEEFIISPSVLKGYIFCPHNVYLKVNNVKKTNSSRNSKGLSQIYHHLFYSVFAEWNQGWILFKEPNIENSFAEFEKLLSSKEIVLGEDKIDNYILTKNKETIIQFLSELKKKLDSFNERFEVKEIEKKLELNLPKRNIRLIGFVDLVVFDKKYNKVAIIDLKNTNKSSSNSSIMSIQFYFYSALLKKIENLNYYPNFYELNFNNFSMTLKKFDESSSERRLLNRTLSELLKSIETNTFPKKIGPNCLECNYSIACRFTGSR